MSKLRKAFLITIILILALAATSLSLVFGFDMPTVTLADKTAVTGVFTSASAPAGTAYTGTGGELEAGTYYLSDDIEISSTITVSGTVVLDLNGHALKYTGTVIASVITVSADGDLTLKDSNPTSTGNTVTDPSDSTKTIDITGGLITGGKSSGVSVQGIFKMMGGTIAGNFKSGNGGGVYVSSSATFEISGGTISGNNATNFGGGVYVYESATFKMSGGTISGNKAANNGGGVYVYSSTFKMTGGTISDNNVEGGVSTMNGGGVYVTSSSTFEMSDGTIIGNKASSGGGVYVYGSGTFEMSGGSISGNNATSIGGGVYVGSGTFEMSGGSISGNNATSIGGGVYASNNVDIGGNPVIKENTINGGAASNLYLTSGKVINVTPALTSGADIGVTLYSYTGIFTSGYNSTTDPREYFSSDYTQYFADLESDLETNEVKLVTLAATVETDSVTKYFSDLNNAWNYANGKIATLKLIIDVTASNALTVSSGKVTLNLNGKTLNLNENNIITAGGEFTLKDESADGRGKITRGKATNGGAVFVQSGTFKMEGGTISGNNATNGGGVYVYDSGTFEMSGGTISGNNATNGGGVFAAGTLELSGNIVINGNRLDDRPTPNNVSLLSGKKIKVTGPLTDKNGNPAGIGVTLVGSDGGDYEGAFTEDYGYYNGDVIPPRNYFISDDVNKNCFTLNESGEVQLGEHNFVDGSRTCTECGFTFVATITVSTTTYYGTIGEAFSAVNNFKASEANPAVIKLFDNVETAVTLCTGAYTVLDLNGYMLEYTGSDNPVIYANGMFTLKDDAENPNTHDIPDPNDSTKTISITGGLITGGKSSGVSVGGVFKMIGGTIAGNSATNGGGVYVCDGGTFYLDGGEIGGNTADLGGGVYVSFQGEFTMSGGKIANNVAYSGGGVFTHGKFTMTGGKISGNTAMGENSGGGGVFASGMYADFKLQDEGVISGNIGDCGAGVFVNGKFVMSGGTIGGSAEEDANIATRGGGGVFIAIRLYFEMTGGTITGNSAAFGGGVSVVGVFKMTGGTISKNTATVGYVDAGSATVPDGYVYDGGGGVYVGRWFETPRHENVHLKHVYFSIGADYGIGTSVGYYKDGVFVMTGGAITENTSAQDGGGVYSYGAFELAGGEISSNTAGYAGGGVCGKYYSYLALTGGSIVNNTAATDEWGYGYTGGGVYVESTCMASLSGAPVIKDNTVAYSDDYYYEDDGDSYTVDNLYLAYEETISVIGAVKDGADVHIKLEIEYGTATNGYSEYNGTTDPSIYFFSDIEEFPVILRGGEVVIATEVASVTVGDEVTLYYEIEKAWAYANGKEAIITLLIYKVQTDSVLSTDSGSITLNLDGNTLILNQNNIQVLGGEFTLIDGEYNSGYSSGQITDGFTFTYGGCIYIEENATFNMNGGNIMNSEAAVYGGGVFVSKNATFTMSGGNISGNKAYHGGGVFVNYGTFKMEGGTIYGNTVKGYGGGVFIVGGETSDGAEDGGASVVGCAFTMSGYSTISGNHAQIGGGVYVARYATFKMEGGTISSNTVIATMNESTSVYEGGNGGGVGIAGGTFILDGGTINGNIAKSIKNGDTYVGGNGGGVSVAGGYYEGEKLGDGEFKFISGTITSNKAENDGGGVYIDIDGTMSLSNGIIRSNTAVRGGGLYIADNATFSMTSGTIGGSSTANANTATDGGGVYVADNATFTINGGTISLNTATNGGGVFVANNAIFTLDGESGIISKNSATKGGGVYVDSDGTFTMKNGTISDSTTSNRYGGGVYINKNATFTLWGGTISGNTSLYGGGVYIDSDSSEEVPGGAFTMEGGTISSNTATGYGGGVYIAGKANFTMNSGTLSGNKASSGGGVFVNGTFIMENGTISSNTVTNGGGVLVNNKFIMKNGKISSNTATNAGGVYVANNAEFTMEGGEISGNTAANGGGVLVIGAFTMKNGTITGNETTSNGGGVYVRNGTFTILGGKIIENKLGGKNSNVMLADANTITIGEKLKTGTRIGINVPFGNSHYVFTTDYGKKNIDGNGIISPKTCFFGDNGECLRLTDDDEVEAGHDLSHHEAIANSCTEDGNIEYWHCEYEGCNKYYSDEEYTNEVETIVLLKLGHDIETMYAVPATCEGEGHKEYLHCKRCDKRFTNTEPLVEISDEDYNENYVLPALGHDMKLVNSKEPTCTEAGFEYYECQRENCYHSEDKDIPATGHTAPKTDAKEATCTEEGNIEYWYCSVCEKYYSDAECNTEISKEDTIIAKKDHPYRTEPEWSWADDYSWAEATFTCDVCEHTRVETATITSIESPATCTENKKITYTATAEGGKTDIREQTFEDTATGHDWEAHWGDWSNSGGEWTIDVEILCKNNLDHVGTPDEAVKVVCTTTDATCIKEGKKVYTASIKFSETQTFPCPKTKEVTLEKIDHSYSTDYTIINATCEEDGEKYRKCMTEGCDAKTDVEVLPATGHKWKATINSADMTKNYTAFETVSLNGLIITFVCENDGSHTHTFTGGTDAANIKYATEDCLHAGDTSIEVTIDGYGTYTIDGLKVDKIKVTAGGEKWVSGGAELIDGYIKTDGYKYYPTNVDGATPVTNAVVRYVSGTVTVKYPDGEFYNVTPGGVCSASGAGEYTATATLTLKDSANYEFVSAEGVTGATLNDDGTLTVTKVWYAAICDNGFTSEISGWTFGSENVPSLPALEKDNAESPATISLVLKRNIGSEQKVIGTFNRDDDFSYYVNSTMPVGRYTLEATVGAVTIDDVEYSGFPHTFTFEVSAASFTVSGIKDINGVTYDGELHIHQTFTTSELITEGEGVWAADEYKTLYGALAITYSHENWSGYYTEAEIAAITNNTLFINAGEYIALYKVSANNYADVTDGCSFKVEIAKVAYDLKDVNFVNNSFEYDPDEVRSLEITGLPADEANVITVTYTGNGKTDVSESGEVIAKLTLKDTDNYKFINSLNENDEHITSEIEAIYKATLTIEMAKLSLSLTFDDGDPIPYDGDKHMIYISGNLPNGVTVNYYYTDNNGQEVEFTGARNIGTYDVKAVVSLDDPQNYEFAAGTQTTYNATLTITKMKLDISQVSFVGKTVTYTGNAYSLSISGTLPAGVTYSYENNNCVEVGTHTVIVHFYHNFSQYGPISDMTAELKITKATYNLGVTFPSATVAYNGNAHSLSIRGTLPAGVTYKYVDNSRTVVGSQLVTVKFYGDTDNYEPIPDKTATLTVVPASVGIANISLEGKTVSYDGSTHSLSVDGTIPKDVEVRYYVIVDGKEVEFNGAAAAGIYDVTARFILADSVNYKAIRPLTARLTILESDTPVQPPVIVEPSVDEIDASVAINPDYDKISPAAMGEIVQKDDFPYWIIAVCIIAVEVLVMAIIGCYIAFWSPKRKSDNNAERRTKR